jgi:hypothetical protein
MGMGRRVDRLHLRPGRAGATSNPCCHIKQRQGRPLDALDRVCRGYSSLFPSLSGRGPCVTASLARPRKLSEECAQYGQLRPSRARKRPCHRHSAIAHHALFFETVGR